MPKFKLKGTVIEELPEIEIDAENLEEAQEKYCELYEEDEIESDGFEIVFDGDIGEEGV
jgi:hypothetical protein